LAGEFPRSVFYVLRFAIDPRRPLGQIKPEIRQRQLAGRAIEQSGAEALFEPRDTPRDRCDRNAQARAAAAKDRCSATLVNIASPSKSGSFCICNPATMVFRTFYFGMISLPTSLSLQSGEASMTHRLAGKIAVVTGGATGIGFASAKRFAAEDARVFITGRRQAELEVEWAWRTSCTRHLESDTRRFGNPPPSHAY
jgi:hypothetical protein